jgi:glycosyltransferase involved in cell wall biosynthesis
VDLLLRGLSLLDAPPPVLVVGDGPQRAELEASAQRAGIEVEWAGHVPYEALPKFYQRSGILVFPTLGDEWGLVVNEALAAGLPVLGSLYSQAVQDLIRDEENGWHFRPDSDSDVADALQRALNTTDEELFAMRKSARESVVNLRTTDVALRFADVLREVTRQK